MRQARIYKDEEGWWVIEVPSLPGCNTQGRTREEALSNIKDAIKAYIAALEGLGLPVPEEDAKELVLV
ncbi:MAG: type II toxin-antitoxin system HicB family antitoxin [Ardenticatenaceae bacterium]